MTKDKQRLSVELEEIADLETSLLRLRWAELFGTAPSPRISRELLIRGVAFQIQEHAHGGLRKSCRRQLERLADELRVSGSINKGQSTSFKPGTKLIREWKDRVHEIAITDVGYVWEGKHYRSLTQIARLITGTGWSGPRFFGLEATNRSASATNAERSHNPSSAHSIDAHGTRDG